MKPNKYLFRAFSLVGISLLSLLLVSTTGASAHDLSQYTPVTTDQNQNNNSDNNDDNNNNDNNNNGGGGYIPGGIPGGGRSNNNNGGGISAGGATAGATTNNGSSSATVATNSQNQSQTTNSNTVTTGNTVNTSSSAEQNGNSSSNAQTSTDKSAQTASTKPKKQSPKKVSRKESQNDRIRSVSNSQKRYEHVNQRETQAKSKLLNKYAAHANGIFHHKKYYWAEKRVAPKPKGKWRVRKKRSYVVNIPKYISKAGSVVISDYVASKLEAKGHMSKSMASFIAGMLAPDLKRGNNYMHAESLHRANKYVSQYKDVIWAYRHKGRRGFLGKSVRTQSFVKKYKIIKIRKKRPWWMWW